MTRSQRAASAGIVGDERERRAAPRGQLEHQVHDRPAGRLVEIAGRLVGDQQRGIGRKRAGERDALLLAAGKLGGIVAEPVGEPDLLEFLAGAGEGVAARPRARAARRRSRAPSWSG